MSPCPACAAALGGCSQACPEERRRQGLARRRAEAAEEARERRAAGSTYARSARSFWRLYFRALERREAPPSISGAGDSGAPSRGSDSFGLVLIARGALILKDLERRDADGDFGAPRPVRRWLKDDCLYGRSSDFMADEAGCSPETVTRRLKRWDVVTMEHLRDGAVIIEGGAPRLVDLLDRAGTDE